MNNLSYRLIAAMLTLLMCLSAATIVFAVTPTNQIFSDVNSTYWGYAYIAQAYSDGVIAGTYYNEQTGERKFSPESTLTYAQFFTILARYACPEGLDLYTAQGQAWNEAALSLAKAWQYEPASRTLAEYNKPIPRYEMARYATLILDRWECINLDNYRGSKASHADAVLKNVPDAKNIPAKYKEYVAAAYENEIISGYTGGYFYGDRSVTRAQGATVYTRFAAVFGPGGTSVADNDLGNQNGQPGVNEPVNNQPQVNANIRTELSKKDREDLARLIIQYTNEERTKKGIAPLKENSYLMSFADTRSNELLTYYSHTRPNGVSAAKSIDQSMYDWRGENIISEDPEWALSVSNEEVARRLVDRWMDSPGHKANILNPNYNDIGVGIMIGYNKVGNFTCVTAQNFGGNGPNAGKNTQAEDAKAQSKDEPAEIVENVVNETNDKNTSNKDESTEVNKSDPVDENFVPEFLPQFLEAVTPVKQDGNHYEFSIEIQKGTVKKFPVAAFGFSDIRLAPNFDDIAQEAYPGIRALAVGETYIDSVYDEPGHKGAATARLWIKIVE